MTKSAFERGKEDFKRGNLNNPYGPKSYLHREWQRGFDKAYEENKEKNSGA